MARGISLREFEPGDAPAVHRWFNSPGATANLLEHRDSFTESDAEAAPELGAIMGDDRIRGKGVGREAERLTNKKAYEEFGAHKVYGRIPAPNQAARKAVIYNGWKQEGVLRDHIRHEGELIDVELWGGFPGDQPPEPED